MTFDKPEHKELIKQVLNVATYPGHMMELVAEVKKAVEDAPDGAASAPATGQ
jgi:hypothetical protein